MKSEIFKLKTPDQVLQRTQSSRSGCHPSLLQAASPGLSLRAALRVKPSRSMKWKSCVGFLAGILCCVFCLACPAAVHAQEWTTRLQFTRMSEGGFPVFLVSLVPGTNTFPGQMRVYLQWSEDMESWQTITPPGDNCVGVDFPLQVVDYVNTCRPGRRFYRVLAHHGCPF